MKLKFPALILTFGVIVFAVYSASKTDEFKPAGDFPRAALVYVQIADLPALAKLWNESTFKEKYASSANFQEFQNSHLGLKLASRWAEFNQASGFPIDFETVAALADKRAALAVYDIGKLEFVFVAPVSDEVFAASEFVQNQNNFEEQTLADGTTVYRAKVESDRGRQKQELIFCLAKNRFVLATSEKLLVQTLNNINGLKTKNSLAEEPSFAALRRETKPQTATVWVNQAALNDDYYFKHYWLMSEAKDLKNIRAGIFDFSIDEGKIVEQRKFLLKEKVNVASLENARAAETLSFLPTDVPFYRLQKAHQKTLDAAIENTLFERRQTASAESETGNDGSGFSFRGFGDYSDYHDDGYRGGDFDQTIDETEDEEAPRKSIEPETDFSRFLQPANPQTVLTFTEPRVLQPAPLFAEFDRAAVFNLSAPAAFDRAEFEAATARKFFAQTLVSASGVKLNWESKTANNFEWRELQLPMLGASASYAVRGNELILTNNAALLQKIIRNQNTQRIDKPDAPLTELTVLNLEQTENAYTQIFDELAERRAADDFFTGNIASLLACAADIKKIEIKERYSNGFLEETVTAFR